MSTPGSTQATRSSASTSSTRLSRVVTITTGSSTGVAPPARPVPLPRATNGRSWRAATRTASATSRPVRGKHTTAARAARDARVAGVERELERFGARPIGSEDRPQVGEERACVVDAPRLRRKRCGEPPDRTCVVATLDSIMSKRDRNHRTGPAREWVTFADPGRRGSHVAGRRDVPAVLVAVHLRVRVPGRLDRARRPSSSTGAAPTARTSPTRPTAITWCRSHASSPPTSGSSPRSDARRASTRRSGKDDDGISRVADPRGARTRASSSTGPTSLPVPGCALHLHALNTGRALQRRQARGLLAAAAAADRRRAGRRHGRLPPHRVRPRRLGRGWRGLRLVVHRGSPRPSPATRAGVRSMAAELRKMLGKKLLPAGRRRTSTAAAASKTFPPVAAPGGGAGHARPQEAQRSRAAAARGTGRSGRLRGRTRRRGCRVRAG